MTAPVVPDPAALARIDDLELAARWVVEGFLSGLHRSPRLGVSTDFAEHRPYVPGDDLRHLDWRLYARTERLHLKTYEADTNTDCTILLDATASMGYGSAGLTKLAYAKVLCATLATFAHRQRDRVGLVTWAAGPLEVVPPGARHLPQVLHALARAEAAGTGDLAALVRQVAVRHPRRGFFVLVSDLYEPAEVVSRALAPLTGAGHDVIVVQLLDPAERDFPFEGATTFRDLETGATMPVTPARVRAGYQAKMTAHLAALRDALAGHRADYLLVDTRTPLERVLLDWLLRREFLRTAT